MPYKFYKVTCKCGHVGRNFFVRIDFPIHAEDGKMASSIARKIPRVKHNRKDAIIDCKEIDYEEYKILERINSLDPYLTCKNIQEQRKCADMSYRIEPETKMEKQKAKASLNEYAYIKDRIFMTSLFDGYDEDEIGLIYG